jgi:GrpB-like predicted nucleotidyltransferase (UPF0157 family)
MSRLAPPTSTRPAPIVVVSYDDTWPARFAAERDAILAVASALVVAVEHVGSTAVVGLAAKPTIDLLVGTRTLADADALIPALAGIGLSYDATWEHELPEGRYFQRFAPDGAHTHHVHAVPIGSWFFDEQVLFRDWLRTNPEDARAYGELKRGLAAELRGDRKGYTDAKGPFIRAVLAKARAARGD